MADRPNETQFSFGEAHVETPAAQRATPAEITAIARKIWRQVTSSKVARDDDAGNDRLLEEIQGSFKDFNTSFPLVLRWMVQARKFNAKAFEKYLLKHASAKLDTRQSFLELQADYLVLLYREENRHPDESLVRRYRASIIEQLLEEDKVFIEMQKEAEAVHARNAACMDRDRRQRLYEFILAQKASTSARTE